MLEREAQAYTNTGVLVVGRCIDDIAATDNGTCDTADTSPPGKANWANQWGRSMGKAQHFQSNAYIQRAKPIGSRPGSTSR